MAFGIRVKATGGDWKFIPKLIRKLAPRIFRSRLDKSVKKAAEFIASEVRDGIESGAPGGIPFTPLAASTIKRKGHPRPLIHTRALISDIKARRIAEGRWRVGPDLDTPHPKGSKVFPRIIDIASLHEVGSEGGQVPARPFIEPVVEEKREEVLKEMLKGLDAAIDARRS